MLQSYTNTQGFQKKVCGGCTHGKIHIPYWAGKWWLSVNQKVSLIEDLIDFDFKSYIKNKKFTIFLAFLNNLGY